MGAGIHPIIGWESRISSFGIGFCFGNRRLKVLMEMGLTLSEVIKYYSIFNLG